MSGDVLRRPPPQVPGRRPAVDASQSVGVVDVDLKKAKSIGRIVEKLYDEFNRCDARATAGCFVEDVVYEDLLLGSSTVVKSREEFHKLIQSHPVFLAHHAFNFAGLAPADVKIVVDSLSEDLARHAVSVEWHVEVDGNPLWLGRGLSFFHVCPQTGLIRSAVDISEAPWRVIGLAAAPMVRVLEWVEGITLGLMLPPLAVACGVMAVGTVLTLALFGTPDPTAALADLDLGLADESRSMLDGRMRVASYEELLGRLIGVVGARLPRRSAWHSD